jgi:hypothetical protein
MNKNLRNELISMAQADQEMLRKLQDDGEIGTIEYHPKMKAIHEKNNQRIKEIVEKYGWPGFDLVGKDGAEAAWLITQHAVLDTTFMKTSLALIRDAVEKKN